MKLFGPFRRLIVGALACLALSPTARAEEADGGSAALTCEVTPMGLIKTISLRGEPLIENAAFKIPMPGWNPTISFTKTRFSTAENLEKPATFKGELDVSDSKTVEFGQTIDEKNGELRIQADFEAGETVRAEGVFFSFQLPIEAFKVGTVELFLKGKSVALKSFPKTLNEKDYVIANANADKVVFRDQLASFDVTMVLGRPMTVQVQDDRKFNTEAYTVLTTVQSGDVKSGEPIRFESDFSVFFKPTCEIKVLKASKNELRGIGGNFCFKIDSPVTKYMLDKLPVGCARIEMPLDEWEPKNDNDNPRDVNWKYLRTRDRAGSNLRRHFKLAERLAKLNAPLVISVWRLPFWMYENPGNTDTAAKGRVVPKRKLPELIEAVLSYLFYARKYYGVEPDYFSFNEPDIGVNVQFSSEDYRAVVKALGGLMRRNKMTTTMLLGDVSNPRGTWTYVEPLLNDPEAMELIKAVGFHSWNGGSPEDYEKWRAIADENHLELYVSEVGVDPMAWKNNSYNSWKNSVAEAKMYMNIMRNARPTGTMEWEFTGDYALAVPGADGKLEPTDRFYFMKHLSSLTPFGSRHLGISCDNRFISCCAFVNDKQIVIHVFNAGDERLATIKRLPLIRDVDVTRSSRDVKYASSNAYRLEDKDAVTVHLPARALSTFVLYPLSESGTEL